MTTTAATWFYRAPEQRSYLIAERLRTSFWDQRLGALWLDTVRAEPPFVVSGHLDAGAVRIEWEPGQWLRASLQPGAESVAAGLKTLLGRPATLKFTEAAAGEVWEWWLDPQAAETRWQALQGKPAFGSPQRLDR